jgi:kumamolisin
VRSGWQIRSWWAEEIGLGPLCKGSPSCGGVAVAVKTTFEEHPMAETHAIVDGSNRVPLPGARALGRTNPSTVVEVTLKLRRKNPLPELNGKAPSPLSRAELAAKYGASKADADAVVAAFAKFGLTVEGTNLGTRTVALSGPVSALENAFEVKLFNYAHESGNYRGRIGNVHVPLAVRDIVEAVFGLDNRRVARRRRQPARDNTPARSTAQPIPAAWYTPAQLATHYQFPGGDGAGQTVAILEFGGGYFPADLSKFCQLAHLETPPTVKAISTDGTSTSARDGAEGEVMLDIEVVAGVCPKASIVAYFAQFTEKGWITALDAAVHDQENDPGVVSVSWGYAEKSEVWTAQAMKQVNQALLEAAHVGVTVCVAAGDDGSSDAIADGHAYTDFPSTSPYALAVGGTTIPSKAGKQPDIVWKEGDGLRSDNGGSTGGGESAVFKRPVWQSAIEIPSVNPHAIAGRVVPDLAANADWDASPYLLVVDGGAQGNGGTSAATPLIGALITLINAQKTAAGKGRVGFVTPQLYQPAIGAPANSATVGGLGCTDVTSGNNTTAQAGGYSAGPGYDAASGWGTPIGTKLATLLP